MTTTPPLRPMSIGDMLDAAFKLYRRHFLTFIGIVALLQVPLAMLQFLVQVTIGNSALAALMRFSTRPPLPRPGQSVFDMLPISQLITYYLATLGIAAVQFLIVQSLITGALANAISRTYHGRPISILGAYGVGARRIVSLVVASLAPLVLTFVMLAVTFACTFAAITMFGVRPGRSMNAPLAILLILLGLGVAVALFIAVALTMVRFLLATQAIVLEGRGPLAALGRSWRLVAGSFWRTVGIALLMGFLVYLISVLPATIVSFGLGLAGGNPIDNLGRNQTITMLLSQIGLIIAMPLQLAVYTLLYYDLRIRKEGYDLELMAQNTELSVAN